MLANENMPPFKWAIVYYNRFFFLALIFAIGIYLGYQFLIIGGHEVFLTYLLLALFSFLIKEVLYQSRGVIYSMGHTRIYVLGILFYLPFLVNAFMMNDFNPVHLELNFHLIDHGFGEFVYYKLLVFSLSIAVLWYIFDIEFDKPSRKQMDIKALLIQDKELHVWNKDIVIVANVFGVAVISLYSLPFGIVTACFIGLRLLMSNRISKFYLLGIGILCLLMAVDIRLPVLNLAHGWWNFWLSNGFWTMVVKQFRSLSGAVSFGVTAIAAPLFLFSALAEIRLSKDDVRSIEYHAKEERKEQAVIEGTEIGVNPITSKPVIISDREFNSHALYLGTTNAGKTTAILTNIEYCAKNGIPCVMLDGKGSPDLPEKIKYLADLYGRKFKLFTLKPESLSEALKKHLAAYNMFAVGTHTEWKNRLQSLFAEAEGRGQQHYALQEESNLNLIVRLIKQSGAKVDLKRLFEYISNPAVIKQLAIKADDPLIIQEVAALFPEDDDGKKPHGFGDIVLMLGLFINSSYGHLFNVQAAQSVIELQKNIIDNEIVLFLFDSSAYKEDTKKIAKMVINDINSAFSTIQDRTGSAKKCFCIFDEFASYASGNLSDTLTLHRTNGVHAIIGTQGIETVSKVSPETERVAEEIIGNCGTFLILQLQHEKDVERLAMIMGTQKGYEVTRQIDMSEGGGATGMGSTKEIDEFIIHPQMIRELYGAEGTGVIYRKANGQKPFKIILRRVKTSD